VRAPAKVNLHLGVGPRRADGYHPVITVLKAVSLFDEITVTAGADPDAPGGSTDIADAGVDGSARVSVTLAGEGAARGGGPGDVSAVPTGRDNLAVRAALLLAQRCGIADVDLGLRLTKGIPVAAGMAGGSADAAGTLLACDALWGTGLDRAELAELAAQLGSDVPFPLTGGTALGTGRGEQLSPVLGRGDYQWVFALAEGGLSTGSVYGEFDRLGGGQRRGVPTPADDVLAALRTGDPAQLGRALTNDLQPAALRLRPSLRRVLDTGLELGAVGAIVSGSGPTCAFLAASTAGADSLALGMAGTGLCRAVRRAHGPVGGARLVEAAHRAD
jgi:4-diphosphocytidyl-2-C-methyl-D-erythritol kinase